MHRVRMLIHFGVIPYIVFDGDYLPSKAATEVDRAKRREESRRKGFELYHLNKPSQAHLEFQKAVDVTPEMARELIDELKKIGVQYVVAPYEADAQLAYLERQGVIQGMLSEDSDLLVFGAKRLLTKLDQYGDCVEINRADFTACREISLVGWSDAEFRRMAILSGCDYLASINRMGLKSAYRYVRKYKTIEKILQMLAFDGQYHVPPGYLERFYKAELTFLHQRVFCPQKNDVVMMTELDSEAQSEDLSFIGGEIEQEVAIGVAKGNLDPMTKQPIYVKAVAKTTPRTSWGNPRRNTDISSCETKASKSIESFFKAKRTPLAELDPNSFTPSPTQERLLHQATRVSWESSPAPAGPPSLRTSMSMPSSAHRPALLTNMSSTLTDQSTTIGGPTPLKRRRLCLEPDDSKNVGDNNLPEARRSRFFPSNDPSTGASVTSTKNKKRGKEKDITIWSDDSVEEAMAELSKTPEKPTPARTRKLNVFKDHDQKESDVAVWTEIRENEGPDEDSQSSVVSRGTEASDASTSTRATSVGSSTPSAAQILDRHVTAELQALTAMYSYQPETEKILSQRPEIKNNTHRTDSGIVAKPPPKPQLNRQRSMTPLQRLGAGALNRSKSCGSLLATGVRDSETPEKDLSAFKNIDTGNALTVSADRLVASTMKGSEDGIIPDSEDSAEDPLSESEGPGKSKLDLGRFALAA